MSVCVCVRVCLWVHDVLRALGVFVYGDHSYIFVSRVPTMTTTPPPPLLLTPHPPLLLTDGFGQVHAPNQRRIRS